MPRPLRWPGSRPGWRWPRGGPCSACRPARSLPCRSPPARWRPCRRWCREFRRERWRLHRARLCRRISTCRRREAPPPHAPRWRRRRARWRAPWRRFPDGHRPRSWDCPGCREPGGRRYLQWRSWGLRDQSFGHLGWTGLASSTPGTADYFTPSSSTSNTNVAFGGMTAPAPRAP